MDAHDDIASEAVKEVADDDAVLFDVRRDDEWSYSHAKGARHVPITGLEQGEKPDIPQNKKIYTYCQAGGRAGRAVIMLKDMGYTDVTSIGGLNNWLQAGGSLDE